MFGERVMTFGRPKEEGPKMAKISGRLRPRKVLLTAEKWGRPH